MELWYPPADCPPLLRWWAAFIEAARLARVGRMLWPLHIDEFDLRGRIDRPPRAAIWVYRHVESEGELYLDDAGTAYRFTPTPTARGPGRFNRVDLRTAMFRAGLPHVVEPVWYEPPAINGHWAEPVEPTDDNDDDDFDGELLGPAVGADAPHAERRRRHLALVR